VTTLGEWITHQWRAPPAVRRAYLDHLGVAGRHGELGVALSVDCASGAESLLVSFNPRRRDTPFRADIARALVAAGLPSDWFRTIDARFGPRECSWIFGFETSDGSLVGATLYVEELSRFVPAARLEPWWSALAHELGCALPPALAVGDPYIAAIDVTPVGPVRLKRYHLLPDGAGALDPAWGTPPALQRSRVGHILQTRSADDGVKVYCCYPYREEPDDRDPRRTWAELCRDAGLAESVRDRLPPAPTTSIGVRVAQGALRSITIYAAEAI
jgi:hypothetical protein